MVYSFQSTKGLQIVHGIFKGSLNMQVSLNLQIYVKNAGVWNLLNIRYGTF